METVREKTLKEKITDLKKLGISVRFVNYGSQTKAIVKINNHNGVDTGFIRYIPTTRDAKNWIIEYAKEIADNEQ